MFKRSFDFIALGGFLARASLLELAAGYIVVYVVESTLRSFVITIALPLLGMVIGLPKFSDLKVGAVELGAFLTNALYLGLTLVVSLPLLFLLTRRLGGDPKVQDKDQPN